MPAVVVFGMTAAVVVITAVVADTAVVVLINTVAAELVLVSFVPGIVDVVVVVDTKSVEGVVIGLSEIFERSDFVIVGQVEVEVVGAAVEAVVHVAVEVVAVELAGAVESIGLVLLILQTNPEQQN